MRTYSTVLLALFSFIVNADFFGPIQIKPVNDVSLTTTFVRGCIIKQFEISNSDMKSHVVTLEQGGESSRYSDRGLTLSNFSKSINIPASSRVICKYTVPIMPVEYGFTDSLTVYIDGNRQKERQPINFPNISDRYNYPINILTNRDDIFSFYKIAPKSGTTRRKRSSSSKPEDVYIHNLKKLSGSFSEDYRGYMMFECIFLTDGEFSSLSEKVRNGIRDYLMVGGMLIIDGENFSMPVKRLNRRSYDWGVSGNCGLGKLVTVKKIGDEFKKYFITAFPDRSRHYSRNGDFPYSDTVDRIVSTQSELLSFSGISFLVFIFIIIVGPVNMLWLRCKNMTIHFLWITPLFSTLFAVALLTYGAVVDGFTPKEIKSSITVLDQVNSRAYTKALFAVISPISLSNGIHFRDDTIFSLPYYDYRSTSSSVTIDATNGLLLKDGWVKSKIPLVMGLNCVNQCRKRLQFYQSIPNRLKVVNGLGSAVSDLTVCDTDGNLYQLGSPLRQGESVELISDKKAIQNKLFTPNKFFDNEYQCKSKKWISDKVAKGQLPNNSYLAEVVGENPSFKNVISDADQENRTVVLGFFEVQK